jgi:hypothetical protein
LPVFYVKDKVIQLPKVGGPRNGDALIQAELDRRDLVIDNTS